MQLISWIYIGKRKMQMPNGYAPESSKRAHSFLIYLLFALCLPKRKKVKWSQFVILEI